MSRGEPGETTYRALDNHDTAAVLELARATVGGTPYGEPALDALRAAIDNPSVESRAFVAVDERTMLGVAVFGEIAGAEGTGRLYLIAVTAAARLRGVATELVDMVAMQLHAGGVRALFAEVPDDPVTKPARALLTHCGFREEARVTDFHRDGVDLAIWRRNLDAG